MRGSDARLAGAQPKRDDLAPIVLKKSATEPFGMVEETRRAWLAGAQAGLRAGGRISFASFRRFWAVAARRNSSEHHRDLSA